MIAMMLVNSFAAPAVDEGGDGSLMEHFNNILMRQFQKPFPPGTAISTDDEVEKINLVKKVPGTDNMSLMWCIRAV